MLELIFNTLLIIGGILVVTSKCRDCVALAKTKNKWFNIVTAIFLWSLCVISIAGLLYLYVDIYIYPLNLFK